MEALLRRAMTRENGIPRRMSQITVQVKLLALFRVREQWYVKMKWVGGDIPSARLRFSRNDFCATKRSGLSKC
jgi:hypothetical protein